MFSVWARLADLAQNQFHNFTQNRLKTLTWCESLLTGSLAATGVPALIEDSEVVPLPLLVRSERAPWPDMENQPKHTDPSVSAAKAQAQETVHGK